MDTWQRIIGTHENHFLKAQNYPHSFRWPTLPPFVKSLLPPFVKPHPQHQPNWRPKCTSPNRLNLIIFFAFAHTLLPANSFKLNLTNNNIKPNKTKPQSQKNQCLVKSQCNTRWRSVSGLYCKDPFIFKGHKLTWVIFGWKDICCNASNLSIKMTR